MTIERTDEMERVLYAELGKAEPGRHHAAVRRGLDAVLALVERGNVSQPDPAFDHVMVYVSEQTNQRRPGVRLVCTCGWAIVAVHADQARPLAQIIAEAAAHVSGSHPGAAEVTP